MPRPFTVSAQRRCHDANIGQLRLTTAVGTTADGEGPAHAGGGEAIENLPGHHTGRRQTHPAFVIAGTDAEIDLFVAALAGETELCQLLAQAHGRSRPGREEEDILIGGDQELFVTVVPRQFGSELSSTRKVRVL